MSQHVTIGVTGPFDLREIALMGFGHRDESGFDGVMRMAFCLDGDSGAAPLDSSELAAVRRQVARVVSLDHDGEAFPSYAWPSRPWPPCTRGPRVPAGAVLLPIRGSHLVGDQRPTAQGPGHRVADPPGRAVRHGVRGGRGAHVGSTHPSQLLAVEAVPGLPADRIPRLHAVAEAARAGRLDDERER